MTCRATTSATTCAGSSPTGMAMTYDNEGRLATWTASGSTTAANQALYNGEGQRVEQLALTPATATVSATTYLGSDEEIAATNGSTTTTVEGFRAFRQQWVTLFEEHNPVLIVLISRRSYMISYRSRRGRRYWLARRVP